jgi:ADP-ribosyl-[dinitrogen reductase] hydrolase
MAYLGVGPIIGDIIGSLRERNNEKNTTFELFPVGSSMTDDSIMTIATMYAILKNYESPDFTSAYREFYRRYPEDKFFGKLFRTWAKSDSMEPIDSCGNGSAMRVGPIGLVYPSIWEVLIQSRNSSLMTHSHQEGIKGAEAVAGAVFLAEQSESKANIERWFTNYNKYNLDFTIDGIRDTYERNVTCQGSVPQAAKAFLEANDYESAIRLAISIGGDSDTIAAMTGSIAEAYYGIPDDLFNQALPFIQAEPFLFDIIVEFDKRFG